MAGTTPGGRAYLAGRPIDGRSPPGRSLWSGSGAAGRSPRPILDGASRARRHRTAPCSWLSCSAPRPPAEGAWRRGWDSRGAGLLADVMGCLPRARSGPKGHPATDTKKTSSACLTSSDRSLPSPAPRTPATVGARRSLTFRVASKEKRVSASRALSRWQHRWQRSHLTVLRDRSGRRQKSKTSK